MRLKIGTSIAIDKDYTENGEKYKSRVVDIEKGCIMIDYPTQLDTGRTAFFIDGTQLLVSFVDELKMAYVFRTEVIGRLNRGIPMLQLTYPGDSGLIKIQRREFVRVESPLDVAIDKDGTVHQLVAEDISAGGMAVNLARASLEQDDIVTATLVLPFKNNSINYVRVNARVVRVWEKEGRPIASLQFDEIDPESRQQVIRLCFERQLKKRNE
ncbi:flagellar brake protein [Sporosarcina trichiuri]|uniref:flagellar brake protein n=1 Tax=Sporosarcina trichiuri TaxID=3056445 RepID=UPI0025B4753C|nr:flagellar brake domain-containing protein [Sporosarcina sp. 0.2-SM1T-5]WJY28608.1 flagellar brake domain-containing protein [Sporosarcina sp. 0.2-SM1T-5]